MTRKKILFFLFFFGGAASLGASVWVLMPGPDDFMFSSQRKMATVKTARVEYFLNLRGGRQSVFKFLFPKLNFISSAEYKNSEIEISFTGNAEVAAKSSSVDLNSEWSFKLADNSGKPTVADGQWIKLDDMHFILFKNAPREPFNFSVLNNKWISVSPREPALKFIGYDVKSKTAIDAIRPFYAVMARRPWFTDTESMPEQKRDGVVMRHYRFKVNKEVSRRFIEEVRRLNEVADNTEAAHLGSALLSYNNIFGEALIGKNDNLLYRLDFRADGDESRFLPTVIFRLAFKNHNAPLEFTAPYSARPLEQVLRELALGFLLPGLPRSGLAARKLTPSAPEQEEEKGAPAAPIFSEDDRDGDGLSDILEVFYGSKIDVADTDGDGVSDGDEVYSGLNPTGPGKLFQFGWFE